MIQRSKVIKQKLKKGHRQSSDWWILILMVVLLSNPYHVWHFYLHENHEKSTIHVGIIYYFHGICMGNIGKSQISRLSNFDPPMTWVRVAVDLHPTHQMSERLGNIANNQPDGDEPAITDNGNYIVDLKFLGIMRIWAVATQIFLEFSPR